MHAVTTGAVFVLVVNALLHPIKFSIGTLAAIDLNALHQFAPRYAACCHLGFNNSHSCVLRVIEFLLLANKLFTYWKSVRRRASNSRCVAEEGGTPKVMDSVSRNRR